jgi:ABC-type transporter Mla maintaining outer membrane lipid asymmetry ATPase subunit MlaF
MMDEISTGLDSSTTFQITRILASFAHVLEATLLVALLQPAPEVYDQFDDILLLSEGSLIFHGPREEVSILMPPPRLGVYANAGCNSSVLDRQLCGTSFTSWKVS